MHAQDARDERDERDEQNEMGLDSEWADVYARLTHDRNDRVAWAAVERRVRGWARRTLWPCGWHAVEDAVTDTCSAVALTLGSAYGAETFSGFVYGHFLNVRRRLLQAARVRQAVATLHECGDVLAAPAAREAGPTATQLTTLRRCIVELPERERHAVALRYYEGLSAAKIAARLGVTEVNARQIVFSGVTRLRRRMCGRARAARVPLDRLSGTGAGRGVP